jgi:hypothetical protein
MNPARVLTLLRAHRPRYADVTATLALVLALGGTAYAAGAIGPNTVGTAQLKNDAVTATKLHADAVTHGKIASNAIDGAKVAANSLSLSDLRGADASGTIAFSLLANTCGNLNIAASGAKVGQVVLFSFTGATSVPSTVAFGGAKVTAANTVVLRACNVDASDISVSNLGIRMVTFG